MPEFEFIKAAFSQPHDKVPVWVMRQAGRYLPEYRAVREKVTFTELCRTPELVADVVKQPIDIFGFDAAILFSDILLPLEPMGITVKYTDNGISMAPCIRTPGDVAALRTFEPRDAMSYVLAGMKETKQRLDGIVPVLGFCGSPFTLLCYMVEGGGSVSYHETKKFLVNYPHDASLLLGRMAEMTGQYLKDQIEAGADAIQLFDSWGGILSPEYYKRFSLPYIKTAFDMCKTNGVPRILYLNNTTPYLELLSDLDCEVISVDWRTDIRNAARILEGKAIQGNLDPHLMCGRGEEVVAETMRILEETAEMDGFIFNLGHGILPDTPVENVHLLVDTVHTFSRKQDEGTRASKS